MLCIIFLTQVFDVGEGRNVWMVSDGKTSFWLSGHCFGENSPSIVAASVHCLCFVVPLSHKPT